MIQHRKPETKTGGLHQKLQQQDFVSS